MTDIQQMQKRLSVTWVLFLSSLVPVLGYAAEPAKETTSTTTTNATWVERATESTAEDIGLPPGASHIPPGQRAESVMVEQSTRLKRATKKVTPEGDIEVIPNSSTAEPTGDGWSRISFLSGASPPSGLDPVMASEIPVLKANGRGFAYGFILLDEYLSEETQHELEALGVTFLGPHDNLYKVKIPLKMEIIERVTRLPYVQWLGYSPPDQKPAVDLKEKMGAQALTATAEKLPIVIGLFDDDADGAFKRRLEATGAILDKFDPDLRDYYAVASPAAIEEISRLDFVLAIEPIRETRTSHDQSMPTIGVDYIRPGGLGMRFDGASTTLGIMDSGFMLGDAAPVMHLDLNKFGCGQNFTTDAAGVFDDQNGHGTHVLGTIVGTGTADDRFRGVAPGVGGGPGAAPTTHIRLAKVFRFDGTGTTSWTENAMDFLSNEFECESPRPQVINYSGGVSGTGQTGTDSTSRKLDDKVWRFQQLYVVAAGNDGPAGRTVASPAVAKNALSVGNVLDFGFQTVGDINDWNAMQCGLIFPCASSQGPTGDDRMKPNVVAPGTFVTSAQAGTTNMYQGRTGTSMATPHVAGLAATLMQHYPEFRGQPYLLRAHLMASAIPHDNVTTPSDNSVGGRNDYGLGRVSAYVAHWAHDNPNGWTNRWAWGGVKSNKWLQFDIGVPSGTRRLVVATTWDEPPASMSAKKAVAYDLDLWIDHNADCKPDAKGQCGEFTSQSFVDNVEYLIINDPPEGTYRLKVIPWDAPSFDLPVGLAATIIRGNPAPNMSLMATPSTTDVAVGSTFTVTTSISNPSYVASGVHLAQTNFPAGLTLTGLATTREDGVTMNFTASELTLGDIIESGTRSALWTFRADTTGSKTIDFRAWSENGGNQTASVTLNITTKNKP